ncbi:hypothetical protein FLA4_03470 [Candidatus Rickettsia kotlanii]|nr:hypothetical protein FLA4_03470 [Candidatus Rickettsia kotlanii]BDU61180.1 hypothetical protein HM2_03480 [Candidatus Rickettsia kotlanii]
MKLEMNYDLLFSLISYSTCKVNENLNAHAATFNCKPKAFNKDPILSTLGLPLLDNILYICCLFI